MYEEQASDVGTMDDMKKMLYKQVKSTNRQLKALQEQQQYVVEMTAVTYTLIRHVHVLYHLMYT